MHCNQFLKRLVTSKMHLLRTVPLASWRNKIEIILKKHIFLNLVLYFTNRCFDFLFPVSFSEHVELQRLNKAPTMAPVLQNPNYLQVDPFPLLNVPQHQTTSTNKDQHQHPPRRSQTPNKSICFEDPPTTLIIPSSSPCLSDEGCENEVE